MRCTPAIDVYLMDVYLIGMHLVGVYPIETCDLIGVHPISPVHFTEYAYYPLVFGKYAF